MFIAAFVIKWMKKMFTNKDIQYRGIYIINCITERDLRVSSGEVLLEDVQEKRVLTKLPFQKILALFIIGHIRITTPLLDKCKKNNVALIVLKPSLRPVFYWSDAAEANYLIRQRQYQFDKKDISIARIIVNNKISNQIVLLKNTRKKDVITLMAIEKCRLYENEVMHANDYHELMGIEGNSSRLFFAAYFQDMGWKGRKPRIKSDHINAILDIGYTYAFNYIECFIRMFGFDLYVGIYHRLWFKRKSLVCDLIEPFRCIIDRTIRTALNKKQFGEKDFDIHKGEYRLKKEKNKDYSKVFFDSLVVYKSDIFKYIQQYYRCFMGNKTTCQYPKFDLR